MRLLENPFDRLPEVITVLIFGYNLNIANNADIFWSCEIVWRMQADNKTT